MSILFRCALGGLNGMWKRTVIVVLKRFKKRGGGRVWKDLIWSACKPFVYKGKPTLDLVSYLHIHSYSHKIFGSSKDSSNTAGWDGSVWVTGARTHARLHLSRALCIHTSVHRLRKHPPLTWVEFRTHAACAARFQTGHDLVVGHSPEVGGPLLLIVPT